MHRPPCVYKWLRIPRTWRVQARARLPLVPHIDIMRHRPVESVNVFYRCAWCSERGGRPEGEAEILGGPAEGRSAFRGSGGVEKGGKGAARSATRLKNPKMVSGGFSGPKNLKGVAHFWVGHFS